MAQQVRRSNRSFSDALRHVATITYGVNGGDKAQTVFKSVLEVFKAHHLEQTAQIKIPWANAEGARIKPGQEAADLFRPHDADVDAVINAVLAEASRR